MGKILPLVPDATDCVEMNTNSPTRLVSIVSSSIRQWSWVHQGFYFDRSLHSVIGRSCMSNCCPQNFFFSYLNQWLRNPTVNPILSNSLASSISCDPLLVDCLNKFSDLSFCPPQSLSHYGFLTSNEFMKYVVLNENVMSKCTVVVEHVASKYPLTLIAFFFPILLLLQTIYHLVSISYLS